MRWTDLADDCLRKQPTTVIYITDRQAWQVAEGDTFA